MQVKDVIIGRLASTNQNITGALNTSETLHGKLISPKTISGIITSTDTISGDIVIPPEKYIDPYTGSYTVVSKPFKDEVLKTMNRQMARNVTVLKIPYYETGNETGYTVYIGGE